MNNTSDIAQKNHYQKYLNDLLSNSAVQKNAYQNYVVDYQNKLQALDTKYKVEKSNFINSEAAINGSEINLAVNKITSDLTKEINTKNKFTEGIDINEMLENSGVNKSGFLDDIKDTIFGKSALYNDRQHAVDINNSQLRDSIKEINAVLGEKVKKTWDGTKYIEENITSQVRLDSIVNGISDQLQFNNEQKETFKTSYSKQLEDILSNTEKYYYGYVKGNTADLQKASSDLTDLLNQTGLAKAGVGVNQLLNYITNANSGNARNATPGTIQNVHASEEYRNAKELAEKAYEKEKENK